MKAGLKHLTWKKFLVTSLFLFVFTFLLEILINYLDQEKPTSEFFTLKEIIRRIITAIVTGFILSLFIIGNDSRKTH